MPFRPPSAVTHALWSDSVYLSCLQHSGLSAEVRLHAEPGELQRLSRAFSLIGASPPGLRQLIGLPSRRPRTGAPK